MTMQHFVEWGKGRSPLLVMVAQQAVMTAEMCYELLENARKDDLPEVLKKLPSVKSWLSLYRGHRRIDRALAELMNLGADGEELFHAMTSIGALPEDQISTEIESLTPDEIQEEDYDART